MAEPAVGDFFASRRGVCVYVTVAGRAIRVEFASEDAGGTTPGCTEQVGSEARAIAAAVLKRERAALQPLFDKVRSEIESRTGWAGASRSVSHAARR
jgi:hypothetical protein